MYVCMRQLLLIGLAHDMHPMSSQFLEGEKGGDGWMDGYITFGWTKQLSLIY
jgi:hypothetical protein